VHNLHICNHIHTYIHTYTALSGPASINTARHAKNPPQYIYNQIHTYIHTYIHTHKHSTFRPSINQYRPSREGSASAAKRLYEQARKLAPNVLSTEERELQECTFKPTINKSRPPESARIVTESAQNVTESARIVTPRTPTSASKNKNSAVTSWATTRTSRGYSGRSVRSVSP
jgi:hypothetical protein